MKRAGRIFLLALGLIACGKLSVAQNSPQPAKRLLIIGKKKATDTRRCRMRWRPSSGS